MSNHRVFGWDRTSIWLVVGLCIAAGLWGGCQTDEPTTPATRQAEAPTIDQAALDRLVAELQTRLDAFRTETGCPGATAAFVFGDGRCGTVATGVSHKGSATPMKPGDRMLSGSIGKTYVAAVMLQLVEEGQAELGTLISHWLGDRDWFKRVPNAETITLRMLMNHTSGIPEHVRMPEFHAAMAAEPDKVWTPEERVAFVFDKPALFSAGEGWSYADTNYIFVGMIIEQIMGRTYYEELDRRILKPLELKDTTPSDRPDLRGLVSGYTSEGNPLALRTEVAINERYHLNPQMEWTGGGLIGTPLDLARWAQLLYGGEVLKPESREQMLQGVPAEARLGPGRQYGLGVIIRESSLGPAYGHAGWFPGYVSTMEYYADHDLAVAIQVNTDHGPAAAQMTPFLEGAAGALVKR